MKCEICKRKIEKKQKQKDGRCNWLCVICGRRITQRKDKSKAWTCNQSCAGKLAWKTR